MEKEIWKGYFEYVPYQEELEYCMRIPFFIEIELKGYSFEGIHQDEESYPYFKTPSKVKGFFEDDFINFTLKYPCLYFINEQGEITLDRSKKHPIVTYYGKLKTRDCYSGHWEIETIIESNSESDLIEIQKGPWLLKKVSNQKFEKS